MKNSSESTERLISPWSIPGRDSILARILGFSLLWWIVIEGGTFFSVLGLLGIGLAVLTSFYLSPSRTWRVRPLAVLRFLPYFFWQSLLGGLDVASRAMRLRVEVSPTVIPHVLHLNTEVARVLFLWVVSLLPGTAAVDIQGDQVSIHALDQRLATPGALRNLEERVAALFRIDA
ncbi:Na+/H+ antiporter subunit E [Desulfonatronum thioautotrophicum]|uniref:Na+/H+ antiporter subunit E n=1 Tax=Desulfonatronum thioautotrophicum TaxID=617001 RepID=UPI00137926EA|nr:Na+/H+ antiporter subunit E [Desulfonatronum thioautotrophicum]